jgi:hypothetical protein
VGTTNTASRLVVQQANNTGDGIRLFASGSDSQLITRYLASSDVWQITASYGSGGAYKPIAWFTSDLERARIDSSGNLGVGVTSPGAKLDVFQEMRVSFANTSAYRFRVTNTDGNPILAADGSGANMIFQTVGAERARLNATGAFVFAGGTTTADGIGITFPATQSASSNANTLDDYERGTWTPSITFGGASTGITYSAQYGYYTKIGNVVYYYCSIQLTSKGSSTGDALVTGLPFTASSATALFPTGNLRSVTELTVTAPSYATATRSNSTINLLDNLLGTQQAITNSNFSNNTEFNVTGFYFV